MFLFFKCFKIFSFSVPGRDIKSACPFLPLLPSLFCLPLFSFLPILPVPLPLHVCLLGGRGVDSSHCSSDCLVITIMELPEESPSSDSLSVLNVLGVYRPPSLDSLPCNLPAQKCRAWTSRSFPRCLLGALCLVSAFKTSSASSTM